MLIELPLPTLDAAVHVLFAKRGMGLRFYARQLYQQVLLRARISYGNSVSLSVRLSVTTRYGFKAS